MVKSHEITSTSATPGLLGTWAPGRDSGSVFTGDGPERRPAKVKVELSVLPGPAASKPWWMGMKPHETTILGPWRCLILFNTWKILEDVMNHVLYNRCKIPIMIYWILRPGAKGIQFFWHLDPGCGLFPKMFWIFWCCLSMKDLGTPSNFGMYCMGSTYFKIS